MDKKKKIAINSIIYIVVFIAILVGINIIANIYHKRIDLTENKIYSLSKPSIKIVSNLKDNLIIKCFFSDELPEQYELNKRYLRDLLEEYRSYSHGKIKFEFIDPDVETEWKSKLPALGVPKIQVSGVSQDKFEVKNIYMGIVFYYQDKKEVIPVLKTTDGLEYSISSIIKKLTAEKLKTVGFLAMGGESIPETGATRIANTLRKYRNVETVRLVKYLPIEDNIDLLVIIGPRMKYSEWTKYQIDQFIMKGKPVIFLIDSVLVDFQLFNAIKNTINVNDLLKKYGVEVTDKVIADYYNQRVAVERKVGNFIVQNTVNYPFYPLFTNLNKKFPFLADFDALYFPIITDIKILDNKTTAKIDYLFKSSKKSYLQSYPYYLTPLQEWDLSKFNSGKEYIGGVVITGKLKSAFTKKDLPKLEDKKLSKQKNKEPYEIFNLDNITKHYIPSTDKGRVVVISDSDFVGDVLIDKNMASFFLNLVDWALDDTGLVNIRTKGMKIRPLKDVSQDEKFIIKLINIVGIPVLLILVGIIIRIWKKREA